MTEVRVSFVGGGNAATAIVTGLEKSDRLKTKITIAEPLEEQRQILRGRFPSVSVVADNGVATDEADVVVLAVKPQILREVCEGLRGGQAATGALFLSIAAGTRLGDIDTWLGGQATVIRAMPNQPALVGKGMTALYAPDSATEIQKLRAESILAAAGDTLWVDDESMIDAVTAISGSGPAYFYLLMEMMIESAVDFGFSNEDARRLVLTTAAGSASVAKTAAVALSELREGVTSPGGTTAAALDSLAADNIRAIFQTAIAKARDRSRELANRSAIPIVKTD